MSFGLASVSVVKKSSVLPTLLPLLLVPADDARQPRLSRRLIPASLYTTSDTLVPFPTSDNPSPLPSHSCGEDFDRTHSAEPNIAVTAPAPYHRQQPKMDVDGMREQRAVESQSNAVRSQRCARDIVSFLTCFSVRSRSWATAMIISNTGGSGGPIMPTAAQQTLMRWRLQLVAARQERMATSMRPNQRRMKWFVQPPKPPDRSCVLTWQSAVSGYRTATILKGLSPQRGAVGSWTQLSRGKSHSRLVPLHNLN
jgi:hypothetical protein